MVLILDPSSSCSVVVQDSLLKITAIQKSTKNSSKDPLFLLAERRCAPFEQNLRLGERIDVDAIKARLENGLLTVMLPYKKPSYPKRVPVQGPEPRPFSIAEPLPSPAAAAAAPVDDTLPPLIEDADEAAADDKTPVEGPAEEEEEYDYAEEDEGEEDGSIEDCEV